LVCGQEIEIIQITQLGLKIICGQFPMNERISQLHLLAAYSNGVGKRMKSSELPSVLPERLCAEQAAKTPLQPLTGSCDAKKRDSRISGFQSLRRVCADPAQGLRGFEKLRRRPERRQTDWAASAHCAATVSRGKLKIFLIIRA
jgi:hypothetical protein